MQRNSKTYVGTSINVAIWMIALRLSIFDSATQMAIMRTIGWMRMLGVLGDVFGILGFLLTVITLIVTMNIRKQLKKGSDKQQFLRDRHNYVERLEVYCDLINNNDLSFTDILRALRNIQGIMEQITIYNIWSNEYLNTLTDFINHTVESINEIDSYSEDPVKRTSIDKAEDGTFNKKNHYCGYCFSVHTLSKSSRYSDLVNTVITDKFRNEYCTMLNKVIAIIKTDSAIM